MRDSHEAFDATSTRHPQARWFGSDQDAATYPGATVMTAAAPVRLYDYPTSICSQMARLALVEKGVPFERRTVDIMEKAEQFETWYTALNPKAVVPTLAIGDEIVTDTIRIVYRVDRDFDGPRLTPADPDGVEAMDRLMRDVMGLHYGVLMYSRRLDAHGKSPIVVARGKLLREQRARYPERAEVLK